MNNLTRHPAYGNAEILDIMVRVEDGALVAYGRYGEALTLKYVEQLETNTRKCAFVYNVVEKNSDIIVYI